MHGNQSHKEDTVIQLLAETAMAQGQQVLSFDLPEHGERRRESIPCTPDVCRTELQIILAYGKEQWRSIRLFGCSLGAYFSLLTYAGEAFSQCLFLSPVVDMQKLIKNMMAHAGVTDEQLEREQEIVIPDMQTLSWTYYTYVKSHPITTWQTPTALLYGEQDTITAYSLISDFAKRFSCSLTVMPGGEHFFHTPEELVYYRRWLIESIL